MFTNDAAPLSIVRDSNGSFGFILFVMKILECLSFSFFFSGTHEELPIYRSQASFPAFMSYIFKFERSQATIHTTYRLLAINTISLISTKCVIIIKPNTYDTNTNQSCNENGSSKKKPIHRPFPNNLFLRLFLQLSQQPPSFLK